MNCHGSRSPFTVRRTGHPFAGPRTGRPYGHQLLNPADAHRTPRRLPR